MMLLFDEHALWCHGDVVDCRSTKICGAFIACDDVLRGPPIPQKGTEDRRSFSPSAELTSTPS